MQSGKCEVSATLEIAPSVVFHVKCTSSVHTSLFLPSFFTHLAASQLTQHSYFYPPFQERAHTDTCSLHSPCKMAFFFLFSLGRILMGSHLFQYAPLSLPLRFSPYHPPHSPFSNVPLSSGREHEDPDSSQPLRRVLLRFHGFCMRTSITLAGRDNGNLMFWLWSSGSGMISTLDFHCHTQDASMSLCRGARYADLLFALRLPKITSPSVSSTHIVMFLFPVPNVKCYWRIFLEVFKWDISERGTVVCTIKAAQLTLARPSCISVQLGTEKFSLISTGRSFKC